MSANIMGLRAYYKGTSLAAQVNVNKEAAFFKNVVEKGEGQIAMFIKDGYSLDETKAIIKGQLDVLEARLCETEDEAKRWTVGDQELWLAEAVKGTEFEGKPRGYAMTIWFMNIAALLKLKVIANDDMNGWM